MRLRLNFSLRGRAERNTNGCDGNENGFPSDARLSFHWRSLALPLWCPHGTRS